MWYVTLVQLKNSSPSGERESLEENSERAIGMEIESWVVENALLFDPASSRLDHDSLLVGHSLKKGRIECCSCFTGPVEPISLPKKQCCCRCFDSVASIMGSKAWAICRSEEGWTSKCASFLDFSKGLDGTWEGSRRQALPTLDPIPRFPTLPEASDEKLCWSASGVGPWLYLQNNL